MTLFKNPEPMNREELEQKFSSNEPNSIGQALLAMAFYDKDWKWSQDKCLYFLEHSDIVVRSIAATCLGHIARIHGALDRKLVEKALFKHLNDGDVAGPAIDALDDINIFLQS